MRKVRSSFLMGTVLLTMVMVIFAVGPAIAQTAKDAVLVKIEPDLKDDKVTGLFIDPATLYTKKNTIIVWMSGVPDIEVQIVFEEGKTCRDVTANPNLKMPGFFLDSKSCYVTSFIPYMSTSTLQFAELGTYEYLVITEDGTMKAKGKIVVDK